MPKVPATHLLTAQGHRIRRNPARIEAAADWLRENSYSAVRRMLVAKFEIHPNTAEKDIAYAKQLIALELNGMEVRAGEVRRNERIADKAEDLAQIAADAGELQAAASLHKAAIAASREVARLTGAYAPKQVQVTHQVAGEIPLRIDTILSVLDDQDLADLRRINTKIEAAKAAGQLPAPSDDDEPVDDAVIVGEPN